MRSVRLRAGDGDLARALFALMANVFGEECDVLSDAYLDRLLSREEFLAIAAFHGDQLIGGVTAHVLPMTRADTSEVFIYDIAVQSDHQRTGVGRALVADLRAIAAAHGIHDVFVLADNADVHAVDFYRALGGVAAPVTSFTLARRDK